MVWGAVKDSDLGPDHADALRFNSSNFGLTRSATEYVRFHPSWAPVWHRFSITPTLAPRALTRENETIATGREIRQLPRLRRRHGKGRWRKRKGVARVRLQDGTVHTAEIHWYEAHGIGRREMKIKFPLLDRE